MISSDIKKAVELLQKGELVAIPTETVYGLAANMLNEEAVRKIFSTKERPFFNPLIVHISGADALASVAADVPPIAQKLADTFWPGPLTLVLPKSDRVPGIITGGKDTVAVRVPAHPIALELLKATGFPLAAPSANRFGSISPTKAEHVQAGLGDRIPMVLDGGPCMQGIESTIVGFEEGKPVIYRLGSITREQIESVAGPVSVFIRHADAPPAPGMLDRHYAPATRLILTDNLMREIAQFAGKKMVCLVPAKGDAPAGCNEWALSDTGNMEEAARNMYDALHQLDSVGYDLILALRFPDAGIGRSLNDRLERASAS